MSVVLVGLHSCVEAPTLKQLEAEKDRKELNNNSRYFDQKYEIYTHEGCEYIVVGAGDCKWGSHKGNCKNPIHKQDAGNN